MIAPTLVWFRHDLRVADQPALLAAVARRGPVIPVYICADDEEGDWPDGAATRWWLHFSLTALDERLRELGSRLIVRRGPSKQVLAQLVEETGAAAIFWNRRYEPATIERDTLLKQHFNAAGIEVESHNGSLLYEPWEIKTKTGGPYQVFTPFSKACLAYAEPAAPLAAPARLKAPDQWPDSLTVNDLKLLPRIKWDTGMREAWTPGEAGSAQLLKEFAKDGAAAYGEVRNRPDLVSTSRLSPALHFGEVTPRQIWHAVSSHFKEPPRSPRIGEPYLRQLLWREFAHHLLFHFPRTPKEPLREEFAHFPWRHQARKLEQWQKGETGYPIVDAGMRELWTTGWMHNRVRMIVASFLVKDLLIPWQRGAEWFWDTLVDADLANNTLGWQWTAGCGADAAPYFRIFNPVSQGTKFDPDGDYVRRWVPELAKLPADWIHQPWEAPSGVLLHADVVLGKSYPRPIVDHDVARIAALEALSVTKAAKS